MPSLQLPSLRPILRRTLRLGFSLGLSAAPLCAASPTDDPVPYLENLPDSNPYRAPFLLLASLPPAERTALRTWLDGDPHAPYDQIAADSPLSDAQRELATSLTADLVALASSPALSAADWPLLPNPNDPNNPSAIELPGVGLARDLTRLVIKTADAHPPALRKTRFPCQTVLCCPLLCP